MYNRLYKQLSNLNIQNNPVSKRTIQLIMHYSNLLTKFTHLLGVTKEFL